MLFRFEHEIKFQQILQVFIIFFIIIFSCEEAALEVQMLLCLIVCLSVPKTTLTA